MRIVDTVPTSRRHKSTRCRHCESCRPRGATSGLCVCVEATHAGMVVVGDQMACGHYRPAAQERERAAA